MREKTLRTVVSFHTTTDALSAETGCAAAGLPGRLIPLPPIISAGCGMCYSAPKEAGERVTEEIKRNGVTPAGVYQMML